ncbi:MAG TPA: hypothetical protein VLT58_15600 [Polyangia bacterium]|nr:hypothetical protein [Polyangia bacterium]
MSKSRFHRWFRNAAGLAAACAAGVLGGVATGAEAVAPEATAVSVAPPSVAPSTPPPPYSIPWQLRPTAATSVVRSDSSVAFYDTAGASGSTVATMLLGSYAVTPHLAPLLRLGFVQNQAPGANPDGSSFVNPIVGVTYARRAGSLRWAAFAGGTIPVGAGSGDHPDPGVAAANTAGLQARSGMDNAMFAVNYFTGIVGADLAYVNHRLTVQAEATLFQLLRVHGDDAGGQSSDAARTNSTMGLHAGYFLLPFLSVGAELRYQRWLSTPTRLVMGTKTDFLPANKDTTTVAIGPRAHFAVGRGMFLRPGISYARALDAPLTGFSYNMVQVDVPLVF